MSERLQPGRTQPWPARSAVSETAVWAVLVAVATAGLVPLLSRSSGLLLLLGILGLLGALLLVSAPFLGVIVILVVWTADFSPKLLGERFLGIPYLVTAVLMVPLGVTLLRERTVRLLEVPQVRLLLAIGLVHLASTSWSGAMYPLDVLSGDDGTQRNLFVFASRLLFLGFVFYFVDTRRRIEAMLGVVVAIAAVAALVSLAGVAGHGGPVSRAEAAILEMNSNRLALVCLIGTAIVWCARSFGRDGAWRVAALPPLFLLPAAAFASGSRSGMLQAAVLLLLVLGEQRSWSARRRLWNFAAFACAVIVIVSVVPESLLGRAVHFDTSSAVAGGESLQSRIAQHVAAVHLYLQHPLLGIGTGNFEAMAGDLYGVHNTLHNSYLLALIEGGPLLLGLYLWLFFLTARELQGVERKGPADLVWLAKGLRFALVLFLVASMAADAWLSELLYLILGLAAVVGLRARESSPVGLGAALPDRKAA